MTKQFRDYKFNAYWGIAIVLALLLALQMSLAPALGDEDNSRDAIKIATYHDSNDVVQNYSCTAGATGNCRVTYRTQWHLTEEKSLSLCSAALCKLRLEMRW